MQEFDLSRWRFVFRNDFTATPGASFTGSGAGGPGLIAALSTSVGSAMGSVGQSFSPSESIETGNAMRYQGDASRRS